MRWYGLPRATNKQGRGIRKASGGIGFLVFNRHLKVRPIRHNLNGALMVEAQVPGCKPCAIIGVYNPPVTSTLNGNGRNTSSALMDDVAAMYAAELHKYEVVLVVGDLNMRLGSIVGQRASVDRPGDREPRRYDFLRFCERLDILPLHGRPGGRPLSAGCDWQIGDEGPADAEPAACTSKCLRAQGSDDPYVSEVDYILSSRKLGPQSYRLGPVVEEAPGTHRPVSAFVHLSASDIPSPHRRTKVKSKLPLANYGERQFWHTAGESLMQAVAKVKSQLAGTVDDIEAGLQQVQHIYSTAMRAAHSPPTRSRRQGRPFGHRFRGRTLPNRIRIMFDKARKARSIYAAARRKWLNDPRHAIPREHPLRRTWQPSPDSEDLKRLHTQCKVANTAAREAAAAYVRQTVAAGLKQLEQQRVSNAHKFAIRLQRLTLEATTSAASGDIPGDQTVFVEHFRQLHQEKRTDADIPGISAAAEKYLADMPAADPKFADVLTAPITAAEVAFCKDPAHPQMASTLPFPHHGSDCTVCKVDKQQLEDWRNRLKHRGRLPIPNPRVNCRLWGGKAPGSAGLHAEHLRFPRPNWSPEEWQMRGMTSYTWRRPANDMLASIFNIWLQHGQVPKAPDFVESVITPIHKKGARDDPNNYRGIATGNVIPKLFGLVLLRRLTHWCSLTGVIPPNQAGFMPYNSAERHVFALLETLKARARKGKDTYLLFLDLKKAYDSVHQGALWHVLAKLGIPKQFINVLQDWNSRRPARIKINGQLTEEFLVTKGLPQGDVLSPLLFNLFISVLMRRIARDGRYTGAQFPDKQLRLRDLWYADDMVGLAESPQQLQCLLDIIQEWSIDWGIDVGIGQGKTNAMHVSTATSPGCNAELKLGDETIGWTDTYRYLGYNLHRNLHNDGYWDNVVTRIKSATSQYIYRHNVTRHLSVASQLQIYNTHVMGSITYLLPLIPLGDDKDRVRIDQTLRKGLRHILSAHQSCIIPSTYADTRALPIDAIILQHRLRFRLDLECTPARESPAAKVYAALGPADRPQQARARHYRTLGSFADYVASDARRFKVATGIDVPAPPSADRRDTHAYSIRVARMFAYATTRSLLKKKCGELDCTAAVLASPAMMAATDDHQGKIKTGKYQAGLHYASPCDWDPSNYAAQRMQQLLNTNSSVTSVSAWAAGCEGSPIALSTCLSARQCRVIQYFRLGRDALTYWPFNQQRWASASTGSPTEKGSGHQSARAAFHADVATGDSTCPFAGCDSAQHHPIHFAAACTSPLWTGYRRYLRTGVRSLLKRMIFMLHHAYGKKPSADFMAAKAALAAQLSDAHATTWNTADYTHVVTRLLTCTPFSAFDIRAQVPPQRSTLSLTLRSSTTAQRATLPDPLPAGDMPLSSALGRLLDSVCIQRSYLRQWANLWCQWAFKYIMALAGHYNCIRGGDRKDVPCFIHGKGRRSDAAHRLHEVSHLGHDAAVVDTDTDDDVAASVATADDDDNDEEDAD